MELGHILGGERGKKRREEKLLFLGKGGSDWGQKGTFWGRRYRFVLLGQLRADEGGLGVHEVVVGVPLGGHEDQVGASTAGLGEKRAILGKKRRFGGEK